jgi:predicted ribosome quality control (RQC) complex YloA/Tae2 family protein
MPVIKSINIPNNNFSIEFVIGKNAHENFEIIDDAEAHHMWFHIEGQSSGHIIAKIDDDVDKKTLRYIVKQGAVLCKQVSKYARFKNINIVYARIRDVEKTDTIGMVHVSNPKYVSI